MLRWRLLLGVIFIGALAGLCWLDWHATRPGLWLLPLAIIVALVGASELLAMFAKQAYHPRRCVVYAGTLLVVLAAALPGLWPETFSGTSFSGVGSLAVGVAIALLIALVGELARYHGSGRATVNLSLAVFAILYVGGLVGFLVQLRMFGGGDGHLGMLALVSLIAIVKSSDIGQYTVGRLFGNHKLAPAVSPGKTWEGAAGGVLFACLAAWATMKWLAPAMVGDSRLISDDCLPCTFFFALVLAAAGMVGDLAESLLKRDAGVKDSSTWMPGFGGVLDLLDSLLVAAPVAYVFWLMGWVK